MTDAGAHSLARRLGALGPGVTLCLLTALAGQFLAEHYGGPALLIVLLLGFVFIPHHGERRAEPGIAFCCGALLRIGVALLGARISLGEFQNVWIQPVTVVAVTVPLVLALAIIAGRALGLPAAQSLVVGASVAICGVAAAMAVAAALPRERLEARGLISVVVSVPALGTVALLVYPALAGALGFADGQIGVLLGATIHDVGQAAASGYLISENAGHLSTLTKLLRVSLLVPLVMAVGWAFRRGDGERMPAPLFLLGFAALMMANSAGLLPAALGALIAQASFWCLLLTMAALGSRTSLRELAAQGWRPVALLVGLSLALLASAMALVAALPVIA